MLARARLGDDAALAHARSKEGLAQGVIELVSAGMEQVLALQVDASPRVAGEVGGVVQGSGPACVGPQEAVQLLLEAGSAWASP